MINLTKEKSLILKGFAILFVLLGHTNYLYNAGAWGVNLFLILSGYGLLSSYYINNNKNFFKNKFLKIYLPFLLVIIIQLLYYLITNSFKVNLNVIIYSVLGLDFNYMYDKTMWYISFIFFNYFIFYFLLLILGGIIKKQKIRSIILILIEFIIGFFIWKGFGNCNIWSCSAGTILYGFAFPIGLLLRFLSDFKINSKIKHILYFICFILCSFILIRYYNNVSSMKSYLVYALSMPIIMIIISQYLEFKYIKGVFNFFGKYSYYIYLWEGFIIFNRTIWFRSINNMHIVNIISILLSILIAFMYGKVLDYFYKKVTKK